MLENTKLSTVIESNILFKLERLGEVIEFSPYEPLFEVGDTPDYLYITLSGNVYLQLKSRDAWVGPGDILGEIGYILNTTRTASARAGDTGCRVWRTPRSLLMDHSLVENVILVTHLLIGLAPYIHLRHLTVTSVQEPDPSLYESHCDYEHPAIQNIAQYLKGADEWDSAVKVWNFVRSIPYRFGFWNVKASQTLELGFGMCTTKANLQVALLRALGITAKFGECMVASKYLIPFLPAAYHSIITKDIKHYFAIVIIDDRQYRADASFTKESLQIMANTHQEYRYKVSQTFRPGHEFVVEKECECMEYKVFDTLSHVMYKKPFFNAENAEAMNVLLDKYQGPVRFMPHWVSSTQYLLSHNPHAARMKALAGIISDLTRLHQAVTAREKSKGLDLNPLKTDLTSP